MAFAGNFGAVVAVNGEHISITITANGAVVAVNDEQWLPYFLNVVAGTLLICNYRTY